MSEVEAILKRSKLLERIRLNQSFTILSGVKSLNICNDCRSLIALLTAAISKIRYFTPFRFPFKRTLQMLKLRLLTTAKIISVILSRFMKVISKRQTETRITVLTCICRIRCRTNGRWTLSDFQIKRCVGNFLCTACNNSSESWFLLVQKLGVLQRQRRFSRVECCVGLRPSKEELALKTCLKQKLTSKNETLYMRTCLR